MFPVDQLHHFQVTNPNYKLIKPWWDVLLDYLTTALLAIALLAGVMQATQSNLVCLPIVNCSLNLNQSLPVSGTNAVACKGNTTRTVLLKLLDRRQYDYVETECGLEVVHWFSLYFSFIMFLEAIILIIVRSAWLKWPKTSSVLDHFVTLVIECHNNKWTILAVSYALWETYISKKSKGKAGSTPKGKQDIELQKILKHQRSSSIPSGSENKSDNASLELSEAIKAKALYEKVGQFRSAVEKNHSILKIYRALTIMQLLISFTILGLNIFNHSKLNHDVTCTLDYVSEDYTIFNCTNSIVPYFKVINITSCIFVGLSGILCLIVCCWLVCTTGTEYNFKKHLVPENEGDNTSKENTVDINESLGDIPPARGSLAFLLHLLSNSNELYSQRFSIFLSKKNEKIMKDRILIHEWPLERLRKHAEDNGQTLKFVDNLSGIPKTLFKMSNLQTLILEDCYVENDLNDERISWKDWGRLKLKSLYIKKCDLTVIPLVILKMNSLKTLDLSDNNIESIPDEIEGLKSLRFLNVADNNITKGVANLRKMEKLVKLNLRGNSSLKLTQRLNVMKLEVDEDILNKMDDRNLIKDIAVLPERDVFVINYPLAHAPAEIEDMRKNHPEEIYKMASNPKGVAVIINRTHRPIDIPVNGIKKLMALIKDIGYRLEEFPRKDFSSTESFYSDLKSFLHYQQYSNFDSVILIFLTDGSRQEELIININNDKKIKIKEIAQCINDSMQGKPKLLFIYTYEHYGPITSLDVTKECSDMVIVYIGKPPFGDDNSLSFQALVDVFQDHAWEEDVISLLKRTRSNVCKSKIYILPDEPGLVSWHSLRKKLYFFPKFFGDNDPTGNNERHEENTQHQQVVEIDETSATVIHV